jgi:predicted phosphodiesterase
MSKTYVVVADNHGDMIDPVMEAKFFAWLEAAKPQVVIHAGDLFDFRAIRSGASLMEKQESMAADYEAGMAFAKRLFSYGKERHWLRGNHDERMWDLLHNESGPLHDHATRVVKDTEAAMRKMKVSTRPYDSRLGVLEIGHLCVIHGYGAGGIASARDAALTYKSCIFGHCHAQDVIPVKALRGPSVAMGTGCLCKIDMPYNARQTNKLRHQQGWVYGSLFANGEYSAFQAKRIGDTVHAATSFKDF